MNWPQQISKLASLQPDIYFITGSHQSKPEIIARDYLALNYFNQILKLKVLQNTSIDSNLKALKGVAKLPNKLSNIYYLDQILCKNLNITIASFLGTDLNIKNLWDSAPQYYCTKCSNFYTQNTFEQILNKIDLDCYLTVNLELAEINQAAKLGFSKIIKNNTLLDLDLLKPTDFPADLLIDQISKNNIDRELLKNSIELATLFKSGIIKIYNKYNLKLCFTFNISKTCSFCKRSSKNNLKSINNKTINEILDTNLQKLEAIKFPETELMKATSLNKYTLNTSLTKLSQNHLQIILTLKLVNDNINNSTLILTFTAQQLTTKDFVALKDLLIKLKLLNNKIFIYGENNALEKVCNQKITFGKYETGIQKSGISTLKTKINYQRSVINYLDLEKIIVNFYCSLPIAKIKGWNIKNYKTNLICKDCLGLGIVKFKSSIPLSWFNSCQSCLGLGFNNNANQLSWQNITINKAFTLKLDQLMLFKHLPKFAKLMDLSAKYEIDYLIIGQKLYNLGWQEIHRLQELKSRLKD